MIFGIFYISKMDFKFDGNVVIIVFGFGFICMEVDVEMVWL